MTEKKPILKLNFNVNREKVLEKLSPLVKLQEKSEIKKTVAVQPKPKAQAQVKPQPKLETQVKPQSQISLKPKPQAQVKTQEAVKLKPKPQGEPKPQAQPKLKPKQERKAKVKKPVVPKRIHPKHTMIEHKLFYRIVSYLNSKYPNCFSRPAKPLKIGIFQDLLCECEPLGITQDELSSFLKAYCRNAKYVLQSRQGVGRVDLEGNIVTPMKKAVKASQDTTPLNNDVAKNEQSVCTADTTSHIVVS